MSSGEPSIDRRFEVTSHPGETGTVDLDHASFPFAGKFGRTSTGTAVAGEADEIVAALAFSPDRTDASRCRIRYLAVRRDRQAEGLGSWLIGRFLAWVHRAEFDSVCIAVDSPFAAVAVARAGFVFTGELGPRGAVVMCDSSPASDGLERALERLAERPLTDEQERYIRERLDR